MDDKRYLLSLIREGEHQQQDFKYRVADACKLAKSVSAFANTDGGRLLIGVRDDGHLSGVRSEEEIYMMHQAAYKYCKPEIVSDGIAIINPCLQDEIWDNWAFVLANFPLEKGHDYIVRLTLKVPSDGAYYIELGSLNREEVLSHQVSVKGSDTFQVIDVEYPEYKCCDAKDDGFVILGCGWVVGTTILKEVELLERTTTTDIFGVKAAKGSNDTLYNLAGQKVNASYKGIVIQNGNKIMK
jgi:hypothetical protein